jgi:hypothetical protein
MYTHSGGCHLRIVAGAQERHCGKHGPTAGWPCGSGSAHIETDTDAGPAPRVIVTGSRALTVPAVVSTALTSVWREAGQPIRVVHGACPTGADAFAEQWAAEHALFGIEVERWHADWRSYGRSAGPRRNAAMVRAGAHRVLAFPLGASHGTRGCIRAARAAGLHVIVHNPLAHPAADGHAAITTTSES